mgnify:CR=1 FL=1
MMTIPCRITRARIILFLNLGENFLSLAMLNMPVNRTIAVAITAIRSSVGTMFKKVLIDYTFNPVVLLVLRRAIIPELNKLCRILPLARADSPLRV